MMISKRKASFSTERKGIATSKGIVFMKKNTTRKGIGTYSTVGIEIKLFFQQNKNISTHKNIICLYNYQAV